MNIRCPKEMPMVKLALVELKSYIWSKIFHRLEWYPFACYYLPVNLSMAATEAMYSFAVKNMRVCKTWVITSFLLSFVYPLCLFFFWEKELVWINKFKCWMYSNDTKHINWEMRYYVRESATKSYGIWSMCWIIKWNYRKFVFILKKPRWQSIRLPSLILSLFVLILIILNDNLIYNVQTIFVP